MKTLSAIKQRFFPVEAVLRSYVQPKNSRWLRLRNLAFYAAVVIVGVFYGLVASVFPVSFYIFFLLPWGIVALLIVWALPNSGQLSDKWLERLLFSFLISLFVWPNYLALSLPGLPWITINRLITAPLALLFLMNLSTSPALRSQVKDILSVSTFTTKALAAFIFFQTATVVFSSTPGATFNKLIDVHIQWNLVFFVSVYIFSKSGRALRWCKYYCWIAIALCVIAIEEWREGRVLWADHIPSFLKIGDESVQLLLAGSARAATGIYRVQSVFATPLNFAEFLALATPFLLYWLFYGRGFWVRALSLSFMPLQFWTILQTDSRLGVVGFFASWICFLGLWGLRRWRTQAGDLIGPATVLAYPFIVSMFIALTLVSNRLGAIIYGNGPQTASTESRKLQWAMTGTKITHWPLGYGMGQGGANLGFYSPSGILTIDSYYLALVLDYGVLGLLAWFCLVLGATSTAAKWSFREEGREANLLTALTTFMFAWFIIKSVLAGDDSHAATYMVLGMIFGLSWQIRERSRQHAAVLALNLPDTAPAY